MSNHTIIKLRRGTAAEWAIVNEVLKLGEPGFEKDTFKLKIGDGITAWNDLPYIVGGFGGNDGPLEYIYDVNMGSDDIITPSNLYFSSLTNSIDYSNFYNYIIDKQYGVSLKLTSKNNSNKFIVLSSDSISKNHNTGIINAFWPSSSIQWIIDGGDDQYDSANFINNSITSPVIPTESPSSSVLRQTSIPYNGGRVVQNSQYWGNNDYVTLYKKSIFSMIAYGNSATMPTSVYYAGNVGADGDGNKDIGSLANYNGYQAGYCRVWGDDPTFTKLIITKVGSTTPVYATDSANDTNDDLFVASGLNSDTIAMVVFYGNDNTNPSNISDIQTLFESFVDSILVPSASINDIYTNFYSSINNVYDSVDSSFWYNNFEFFTGTNNGNPNYILAEGGSGSGLEFSVTVNQDTNEYVFSIDSAGINYQNGDIIVLRGDSLNSPNGRSPDEDIYLVITSIDVGGEVLAWDTITDFIYSFSIDSILSRSDGFRFVDNEIYYLNIDIIGGQSIENIEDILGTSFLVAGSGIILNYNDAGDTLTISANGNFDAAVPWTANHTLADGTRYLVNDLVYQSGNLYKANYDNESIPVSNTTYWTNVGPGYRLNIDGRDIPNIPYPVEDIAAGTGISIGSVDGVYTITSTGSGVLADQASSIVTTVFNETGSPIPKMKAVYIDGGHGDRPTVSLALATGDPTSAGTYGVTLENIDNMELGQVIVFGALTGVNTDPAHGGIAGATEGSTLYLSPTTPGGLTTTKPSAPNHMVVIGTVVRVHQNEGVIEVRIQNGFELDELHNVAVSGVTGGQFLQYNSSSQLWVPSSSGNFTTLQVSGTNVSLNGHTHTISNITDFPTIANSGDNRMLTSTGTSTGINAESNLTFDGSLLLVDGTIRLGDTAGNRLQLFKGGGAIYDYSLAKEGNHLAISTANDGSSFRYTQFGYHSGSTWTPKTVINNYNGNVGINTTAPTYGLHVVGTGYFNGSLDVDNLKLDGNTLSSTNSNGNIVLAPNGTGDVQVDADTLRVGDSNAAATITSNGTGNLTISTNSGTNSGSIVINQGSNGNISITPNGTGEVDLSKVDIDGGSIDNTIIGATSAASGKFTQLYPTVVSNGSVSGSVGTDVSAGQIFDMTLTGATTLTNPTNAVDGVTVRWRITQDGTGGHSVSLDTEFQIPSSASSPLPWSTAPNATDILAATYHAGRSKWDVVAFVPGY